MTIEPEQEEALCLRLRAWVEEWGPENVVVHMPTDWENPTYSLGPTKLVFTTADTVRLEVHFDGKLQQQFEVQLTA